MNKRYRIVSGKEKPLKSVVEPSSRNLNSRLQKSPYMNKYSLTTLQKYEDLKTVLEIEYDEEMKSEWEKRRDEKVDMRKMIREHDKGTQRLIEMSERRTRLMKLMINKDFKSFNNELRPQQLQLSGPSLSEKRPEMSSAKMSEQPIVVRNHNLKASSTVSSNLRSSQARSLV